MQAAAALNHPREMPQDIRWMNAAAAALAAALVVLLVAAGLIKWSRQAYFDIRRISVEGDLQRNNLATVRANVLPHLKGGFFTIDLARARDTFEALPWVRHAVVRRIWPNELRVTLEEHRPAAYWHHADREDELVNTYGEVFDANIGDVEDEPLPTLAAPANPTPDEARVMLDMLHRLQPLVQPLQGDIDTLQLTDRGSWSVELDNDANLELGRGNAEELQARIERFVRTLPVLHRQYPAPLVYADLRYPEGYAVRLRGVSTSQETKGSKPVAPKKP